MNVQVSASTGEKYVQYLFGTGTSGALSGGNAKVYLGYPASEDWVRFERNVEADFEAYAGGGATWTNTDGLYIYWPKDLVSDSFFVDDIRLSDSLTVEHNVLAGGGVGQILRQVSWDPSTLARSDRWFHYDQVGSVMCRSNGSGTLQDTHYQDAFGNSLASWATGLIGGDRPGRHHNTKEFDEDIGLVYMFQRWYSPELGVFVSSAPYPPMMEHRYSFAEQNPVRKFDPWGRMVVPATHGRWVLMFSGFGKSSAAAAGGGALGTGLAAVLSFYVGLEIGTWAYSNSTTIKEASTDVSYGLLATAGVVAVGAHTLVGLASSIWPADRALDHLYGRNNPTRGKMSKHFHGLKADANLGPTSTVTIDVETGEVFGPDGEHIGDMPLPED